jgi:SAM-dependent methyltransferase
MTDGDDFENVYSDERKASAYSALGFENTYYLAYRDLPDIIGRHVTGRRAVDFGCGAGRSTRFLKRLGFEVVGIDISEEMLAIARRRDPGGRYVHVEDGRYAHLGAGEHDLVQSIFTFDNIPGRKNRVTILSGLVELLVPGGRFVMLGSNPEMYWNEWASFSTKDFPENRRAGSGESVLIINTDIEDRRPVEDIIWFEEDYQELFDAVGLELVATYMPLGGDDEPFEWTVERELAPWFIYVLEGT